MEKYTIDSFKRNDKIIKTKLKNNKDTISVTETLHVYYPKRFEDIKLANITTTVKTVGIFIITDNKNNYAFINLPLIIEIEPSIIEDVVIDDVMYTKLTLVKDNLLLVSKKVLKDSSFIFTILDEFIIKGKVPFYMEYESLVDLFLSSGKYNGAKIGNNPAGLEAIISTIARDKENPNKFIRSSKLDPNKLSTSNITFIGLNDVNHGLTTNVAKLTGAHLNDGLTSVLLSDDTPGTEIENYYRM